METATAQLNSYRQSPRKVRVVADLIRGKKIEMARALLQFADKKAALQILKLLNSAVANAQNKNLDPEMLIVREISVNGGRIMYRQMPMARGRAFPIRKRTSSVVITLGEKAPKQLRVEKPKSEASKETKKAKPKAVKASKK